MARGKRYTGEPRTELERFVRALGLTVSDVADGSGVKQPTVSRLIAGTVKAPSALTYLRLSRWADRVAREKRLPRRQRLDWEPEAAA